LEALSFEWVDAEDGMICRGCGVDLKDGSKFCGECGADQTGSVRMPAVKADPRIGTTIEEKYRIDAQIGMGGMATVYRATRLLIGDTVAVKILHAEQFRDAVAPERFRREAQAAARLKHPNAVTIYDFGVADDGLVYLVMELVEGQSLRKLIKEQGPLMPSAAAEILTQACGALQEAHDQQVVHRDIKPDNIIVAMTPTGVRVKVLDFGIARLRDVSSLANLTQTGSVMGTPQYMSPEQCLGEELDGRSDIYSLGIVLYEMLAGVVPFNSPTSLAVVVQHVNTVPASLRILNVSIPPAIEAVVMRALEKRREARPQTAAALAAEFSAAASGTMTAPANLAPAAPAPTIMMQTPWSTGAAPAPASWTHDALAGARQGEQSRKRPVSLVIGGVAAMLVVSAALGWVLTSRKNTPLPATADTAAATTPTPIVPAPVPNEVNSTPAPTPPAPAAAPPPTAAPAVVIPAATTSAPQTGSLGANPPLAGSGESGEGGSLTVRTTAGSTVQLDGVSVGTANSDGFLILSKLRAGRHQLVVHKDHYADVQQSIAVVAGQEDVIEIRLQPQHGTTLGTAAVPAVAVNPGSRGDSQIPAQAVTRSPEIIGLSADRLEVEPNQAVTLRVSASDPNADPLRYAWTTTAGSIEGRETTATLRVGPAAAQQRSSVTVTVTARNSRGMEAYKDIVIKLKPLANVAPDTMRRRAYSIGPNIEVWLESAASSRGDPSGIGIVETELETVEGVWQITSVHGSFPGTPITVTPECRNCEFLGIVENPSSANGFMRVRLRIKPLSPQQPLSVLLRYQTQIPAKKK
jgi:serine/threonine protein kinase